jgi:hypothetical protein
MTYAELYEKVKPELEKANNMPFKEYKKVRKTFSQLFEECDEEECKEEENAEESSQLHESYNNLYEKYVSEPELEPLTEQEAIYLIARINEGERLSESELQRLDEVFGSGMGFGQAFNRYFNPFVSKAYKNAYDAQKTLNKSNKQNIKQNKFQNQFAAQGNKWLQKQAANNNYQMDADGKPLQQVQQTVVEPNTLKKQGLTPENNATNLIQDATQVSKNKGGNPENTKEWIQCLQNYINTNPGDIKNIKTMNALIQKLENNIAANDNTKGSSDTTESGDNGNPDPREKELEQLQNALDSETNPQQKANIQKDIDALRKEMGIMT